MSTPEQILKVMAKAKATAQAPLSVSQLVKVSRMDKFDLQNLLDNMYHTIPSSVNRAYCFKKGEWAWFYWPTGIIQSSALLVAKYGRTLPDRLPPPRRVENKPQAKPALTEKETEMSEKKITHVDIVKVVIANPGIDSLVLRDKGKYMAISVMLSHCFKQEFLKKNNARPPIISVGDNELWLAQHGLMDTPKGGVAAAQLESEAKPAEQQTSPEAQAVTSSLGGGGQSDAEGTAIPAEPTAQPLQDNAVIGIDKGLGDINVVYEIPAFLRKENQPKVDHHVITETVTAALAELNSADFTPAKESVLEEKPQSKVRFAITSDRTLLIFNLQDKPIELNADATAALDEFLGDIFLIEHENRVGSMTL